MSTQGQRQRQRQDAEKRPDRGFLRRAVAGLNAAYRQEQRKIAQDNRRKTLLVGLLLAFVLSALLITSLIPA